ncbi:pth11-like integral membrane protein [Grosmannia clavigera kw1407]|uniref:Pth11-like integral membrane protein n=1 Tax=Grosmannia clavigera (strain kw1407 / UAMH 11150) TaxID=655863 RepID=F0XH73_GROCL|nr:pth11-like integral membrane protein [Grosmannia clavigera kw1407]EFX02932.1 pth11-like integral membrane protein [Grosmannia clavigera kw1407]
MWYDDYAIIVSVCLTSSTIVTNVLALSVTSAKVSVLLLYRRLFTSKAGTTNQFKYMFLFASVLTGVYLPILWITMACACRPVSYYWTQYTGGQGSCINVELFFLVLGIVNMINDVIILIVPIPSIWVLQMNSKTKASVIGIMMLGSLVCLASIFRIYYLNGLAHHIDATWWMGPGMAWSCIEPLVAIISACLPTLAPLFRLGRNKDSSGKNSGSEGNDQSNPVNSQSGRYVLSSTIRANGGRTRLNDDEVELTCTAGRGDHATRLGSTGSSDEEVEDGGITVQTQVSVVASQKV